MAGYEDANDPDGLRHDPLLQIVADQKVGNALGSQPTLSRWENSPTTRDLPGVHPVISPLKRRLLGTHQGAIGHHHLDDYLDEFTFRFNSRQTVLSLVPAGCAGRSGPVCATCVFGGMK